MAANYNPFEDPQQVIRALAQQKTVCSEAVAQLISTIGKLRVYANGEVIARQGELGAELFYILSGSVQVVVRGHEYKIRNRGELIGEMAVIEPGERRSADLIAAQDSTMLWVVAASDFLRCARKHGEMWECVARELACRLRQRDQFFAPPNEKPVVFIGSSAEGVGVLNKTVAALTSHDLELRPWNKKGMFRPSAGTLEELERHAREADFAVLICTADDIRDSRGREALIPRDNVMLEFGLFMGGLERQRTFLLVAADPDLALASDLHGVTVLYFKSDTELSECLSDIEAAIRRIGRIYRYCQVIG